MTLSLQPMHTTMLLSFAAFDRASVSAEGTATLFSIILQTYSVRNVVLLIHTVNSASHSRLVAQNYTVHRVLLWACVAIGRTLDWYLRIGGSQEERSPGTPPAELLHNSQIESR